MAEFNQMIPPSNSLKGFSMGDEKRQSGLNFKVYQELKSAVHRDLLNKVDLERVATVRDERTRAQALAVIQDLVANLQTPMSGRERERLALEVLDEVFGLGPLEPLLQDPTINDILVNGHKQVYVERAGMLEETNIRFKDNTHLMHIIDKIVSDIGRHVDESSPMVDARLADGSRVNVIIPPLAVDGPHLSIRRFGHIPLTDADLLANQTLTPANAGFDQRGGQGAPEHRGFRWNRRRKNDFFECALKLHLRQGKNCDGGRLSRTAAEAASRRPVGVPSRER